MLTLGDPLSPTPHFSPSSPRDPRQRGEREGSDGSGDDGRHEREWQEEAFGGSWWASLVWCPTLRAPNQPYVIKLDLLYHR